MVRDLPGIGRSYTHLTPGNRTTIANTTTWGLWIQDPAPVPALLGSWRKYYSTRDEAGPIRAKFSRNRTPNHGTHCKPSSSHITQLKPHLTVILEAIPAAQGPDRWRLWAAKTSLSGLEGTFVLSNAQTPVQDYTYHERQANITPLKETNKVLVTYPK